MTIIKVEKDVFPCSKYCANILKKCDHIAKSLKKCDLFVTDLPDLKTFDHPQKCDQCKLAYKKAINRESNISKAFRLLGLLAANQGYNIDYIKRPEIVISEFLDNQDEETA